MGSGTARSGCTRTATRRGRGIPLILRQAYGGAYIAVDAQSIGADLTNTWPTNEISVMGAEGAARRHRLGVEGVPRSGGGHDTGWP